MKGQISKIGFDSNSAIARGRLIDGPADSGCSCHTTECQHGSRSLIDQIHLLAAKEFGDRFRSGWVLACVLVWLGAIGLASFLGLLQMGRIGVQGYERTVMSLLNVVQYLIPL